MQVPYNYSLLLRGGRGVVTSRTSHPNGALSPRGSAVTDHLSHQYDWGSAENRHRRTGRGFGLLNVRRSQLLPMTRYEGARSEGRHLVP